MAPGSCVCSFPSVIMVSVWKDVGFLSIIFLGDFREFRQSIMRRRRSTVLVNGSSSEKLRCLCYLQQLFML